MGNETFKKRQKEAARREKRQKKAARLVERKNEKEKSSHEFQEENPEAEAACFATGAEGQTEIS